jgi:hypothetical protein
LKYFIFPKELKFELDSVLKVWKSPTKYKLEIRNVRESAEWRWLPSLLHETSLKPSGHAHDHRTAVLLFDKDGRRISSRYFEQFGTEGTINGGSGTISGGIYLWAKSLLKGVAD